MTSYRDVVEAFKNGDKAHAGNYLTDGKRLYLFGNVIAERTESGGIRVTDAGYPTHTTHKALRALGVNIRKKGGRSFIDDKEYERGSYHEFRARHGYHGVIRKPTHFLVGEGYHAERVNISPIHKIHHGKSIHVNYLGGRGVKLPGFKIKMPKFKVRL
jgi:hypothetical protein